MGNRRMFEKEMTGIYHEVMTRLLFLLPAVLSGCSLFSSGVAGRLEAPGEELKEKTVHVPDVAVVHPWPVPAEVAPGPWAACRLNGKAITFALVAREKNSVWIEFLEEAPVLSVSARKIDADGRVLEAWFRPLPEGEPLRQTLVQTPPPPGPPPGKREIGRSSSRKTETFGGKECDVEVLKIVWEDLDGLRETEEECWSRDVPPLFGKSERGGLVRGKGIEVLDFGSGATRKLAPIPADESLKSRRAFPEEHNKHKASPEKAQK